MRGQPMLEARRWWMAAVLLLAAFGPISVARGQSDAKTPAVMPSADEGVKPIPTVPNGDGVVPAGCPSCGGGLLGGNWGGDCLGCGGCGSGQCSPGRRPCDCCCDTDTVVGRFFNGIYQCVCCPDPCYDPQWLALADAAFFADAPRPITQIRLRIDQMWDMNTPDRAEYFWARQASTGRGRGPNPNNGLMGVRTIDVSEVKLYTEAASGRAGFSVEVPYRRIERDFSSSGFSDIVIGTKAMLLDCQLIQITFGFTTFIPSGSAGKGIGTGHVSLEPSLLWALRLTPSTYLQAQTSLWIPISGDPDYQGNIFHYHLSLNQTLWRPCQDIHLIGTGEFDGWVILSGSETDPFALATNGKVDGRGHTASAGPGIRLVMCDKIDFGIGSKFALNNHHWADEMVRFELRWRF